ncbi:MAG: reverse transcriptase/maturase family protein [Oscillospiraceae bacterium]|nr:reverse transcriptase/maturase family protein [Oscillospiraceae bacterium]
MESLLYELNKQPVWLEYAEYKSAKNHFTKKETKELSEFINNKKYENVVSVILNSGNLSIPQKILVNKLGGGKRVVYSFNDDENMVLKLLSYLLYRYDNQQSPGCYSFRKGFGAHKAIRKIINVPGISEMWCYKSDIKNYFNSISVPVLLSVLEPVISGDKLLYQFLYQVLSENKAVYEEKIIRENRGVMAGTPISPFLANIYLKEVDTYFCERKIIYARYSDDIIIFAETEEKLTEYKEILYEFLNKYKLTVNVKKEKTVKPGEAWEYLGVEYQRGRIDLSSATKQKLKRKIKRKARALRRWRLKKNAGGDQTMKVMIRVFNRKFFEKGNKHDLTWSKWFFPVVTEKNGFQEIDSYLQQYIRYIPTGCHGKKNYKTTYSKMKELGYKSLVNEYYKFKKNLLP